MPRMQLLPTTILFALLFPLVGCEVPAYQGQGMLTRIVEPKTQRGYWRYLPKDYVDATDAELKQRRWPTVVSFHGMKPFDNSVWQAREWAVEADRYGFVVVSPELGAADLMQEFPLQTRHPEFKKDEEVTLAVLDHLFATTQADPSNVLATGWSSGGYMAHYMFNRYPSIFNALSPRQSNFSWEVLDLARVSESRDHPILIINTENDFASCREESAEAVQWYDRYGYRNMGWVLIRRLGHQRTPDLSADFFARITGVKANSPPRVLADRQAIDGNAAGLAILSGGFVPEARRPQRDRVADRETRYDDGVVNERVGIRVSSAIGIEPLRLSYSAAAPRSWLDTASFLWILNGEPIGSEVNGQRTLTEPGEHTLELIVVTVDNVEHHVSRKVRVLPQIRDRAVSSAAGN